MESCRRHTAGGQDRARGWTLMADQGDVRGVGLSLPATTEDDGPVRVLRGQLGPTTRASAWVWHEHREPNSPRGPRPDVIAVREPSRHADASRLRRGRVLHRLHGSGSTPAQPAGRAAWFSGGPVTRRSPSLGEGGRPGAGQELTTGALFAAGQPARIGNAVSLTIPGGDAAGAAVQFRMLSTAGVDTTTPLAP